MVQVIENVLRVGMGRRYVLFGLVGSDKVRAVTMVPVVERSSQNYLREEVGGYQRPASAARMRAFMRFLQENPHSVVPPVLLSTRSKWTFVPSADPSSRLGSVEIRGPAAVIDGQHRLGGYVALYEKGDVRDVTFIAIEGMTLEEERQEFITVNNTQKGVPRSLTAYLEGSEEAQIAWALNEDPDSPFFKRIARTGKRERNQLYQLHSVARQMRVLFEGKLARLDTYTKIDIAERYFTIVSDALPDEWSDMEKLDDPRGGGTRNFDYKLLELTGLIAWTIVGNRILDRCYSFDSGMNWENVRRLVRAAAEIDWSKGGKFAGRTGLAGGRVMAQEMLTRLPAEGEETEPEEG